MQKINKSPCFPFFRHLLTFSSFILLFAFPNAFAALSTSSAQTIQGRAPGLTFDSGATIAGDLNELLSFTMPDGTTVITPSQSTALTASTSDTFNDFIAFVSADGNANTLAIAYYKDLDGDTPHAITPISGSLTATWKDSAGITITNLANSLSGCKAPYTLTIEANNITVNSAYGHPLSNPYGTSTKTYTFNVGDSYEICYLQPNNTSAGITAGLTKYPLGYNPAVFTLSKGFSKPDLVSVGKTFPTTGFNNAKFLLKMSHAQSDYTYASDNANVSISNAAGSEGLVTLGPNKPTGTVTLTATPKPPATAPALTHSFAISLWAEPIGTTTYQYSTSVPIATATQFPAASMCKNGTLTSVTNATEAASYFFTRAQLTNSPYADNGTYPAGTSPAYPGANYYSRDADTTFTGEWGNLFAYPAAGWSGSYYWTSELWDSSTQFVVNAYNGTVTFTGGTSSRYVVCSR